MKSQMNWVDNAMGRSPQRPDAGGAVVAAMAVRPDGTDVAESGMARGQPMTTSRAK